MSEVPRIFLDQLEIVDSGDISNIIESNNGYYIFYLEDKKEVDNVTIEERRVRHILIKRNGTTTDVLA